MLRLHLIFLLSSVALVTPLITYANNNNIDRPDHITIGAHPYPPYYDKQGRGLWIDIYRAAYAVQDIEVRVNILPIQRALPELLAHRIDAQSPGTTFLQDSKEELVLVKSVKVMGTVFCFCQSINPNAKNENFNGKKVALINQKNHVRTFSALGAHVIIINTPEQMIKMAHNDRVDYFGSTLITGLLLNKHLFPENTPNNIIKRSIKYGSWANIDNGLAFTKSAPHSEYFISHFKAGLKEIINNGTYLNIMEDYWGVNNVPRQALPERIQHLGVEQVNLKQFSKAKRNDYFKITDQP